MLFQDKKWFDEAICRVVGDNLSQEYVSAVAEDKYFIDFMRDMDEQVTEELSDDSECEVPRVYEMVTSWDALGDRLNLFMSQYNEHVRT